MTEIRKMEAGDLPRCAEILEAAYKLPPYNEKFAPGVALGYVENKFNYCAGHSFVAVAEGVIAGFILTSLSVWVEGGQAIVEEVVVSPARQGQGIGKALVAGTDAYLRSRDVHSVLLWSRRQGKAHAFHEKSGFRDAADWVIMHKAL